MRAKRVLITGGLGFIGINLTRELVENGWGVRLFDNLSPQIHGPIPSISDPVLDSPQVEVIRGDICRDQELGPALDGMHCVVHLAAETGTAQSMYQVPHYNMVNSQGTAALMGLLAEKKHSVEKIVLASSRSIYGEGAYACPEHGRVYPHGRSLLELQSASWDPRCPVCSKAMKPLPTGEDAVPAPESIYAATKLAQEHLIRIAGAAASLPTVILRLQNVFGAGQSLNNPYTGILSIFSTRIRRGMTLPIFEDGRESRDFVHVSDVARAFRLALETDAANGGTFNIGSGYPTSVMEVAELLVEMLGGKIGPTITGQYRLGDIRHCFADMTKASEILGFLPKVGIRDGLRQFVDWVLTQPIPEDGLEKANNELKASGLMS